jgi:hypothetical protein
VLANRRKPVQPIIKILHGVLKGGRTPPVIRPSIVIFHDQTSLLVAAGAAFQEPPGYVCAEFFVSQSNGRADAVLPLRYRAEMPLQLKFSATREIQHLNPDSMVLCF